MRNRFCFWTQRSKTAKVTLSLSPTHKNKKGELLPVLYEWSSPFHIATRQLQKPNSCKWSPQVLRLARYQRYYNTVFRNFKTSRPPAREFFVFLFFLYIHIFGPPPVCSTHELLRLGTALLAVSPDTNTDAQDPKASRSPSPRFSRQKKRETLQDNLCKAICNKDDNDTRH